MPTIGVAIPCYKPHLGKLLRLLDSLEAQIRKPDHVVVSSSSTTVADLPHPFPSYSFPLTILVDSRRRKAAENRNACISTLDCDIVSFVDADDVCHPRRLELLLDAHERGAELIIHSFTYDMGAEWASITEVNPEMDVLARAPSGCLYHSRRFSADIAHGHVSVSRRILSLVRFGTTPEYDRREDASFCAEAIGHCAHTAYIAAQLTKYDRSGTGGLG
jgi:hypothetical protein